MIHTYSMAESNYPNMDWATPPANTWPEWKRNLSDERVLYRLGFHRVSEYEFKRIQGTLALYLTTPNSAFDRIKLWATYVDHKIKSSHMEIRAGMVHGGVPDLVHYLLRGCDNSLIVSEMDTSN